MRARAVLIVATAVALAALSGCAPAPEPTRSDPGMGTCDPVLYTSTIDLELDATAEPLPEPGFPFDELGDSTCTAHLTVADGQVLDVALYNVPADDLAAQVDALTTAAGWMRDDATTWREGDHVIRLIEIEEGVLVTVAA